MEEKRGRITRQIDHWSRRKGIIALCRKKEKGKVRISSQVIEQEEARRAGSTEHESTEESGKRENLAMVCDGQQARTLMG